MRSVLLRILMTGAFGWFNTKVERGKKTYYCQHVWVQRGGRQSFGWAGLNLQCTRSHLICRFVYHGAFLRFTWTYLFVWLCSKKKAQSVWSQDNTLFKVTRLTPWPHLSEQLNMGFTGCGRHHLRLVQITDSVCCGELHRYHLRGLSSPSPITHRKARRGCALNFFCSGSYKRSDAGVIS